jgi:hypothetical protein
MSFGSQPSFAGSGWFPPIGGAEPGIMSQSEQSHTQPYRQEVYCIGSETTASVIILHQAIPQHGCFPAVPPPFHLAPLLYLSR